MNLLGIFFHPGLPGGEGVMILRKGDLLFAPGNGEGRSGPGQASVRTGCGGSAV